MSSSSPGPEPSDPSGHKAVEGRIRALEDYAARFREPGVRPVLDAAAAELIGRLEEDGVEVLLLKGPALARLLYQANEHRRYMDLDVLIAPASHPHVAARLAELGYRNISEQVGVDDFMGVLHGETWRRRKPHGVLVDLHWRLAGCGAAPGEAWPKLYASRTTIELAGREVAVLSRPGLALHLATHAAQHGPRDLKAMGDMSRGLERWPRDVWRDAAALAAEVGATEAFSAGLRLLPEGEKMAAALALPATPELSWRILNQDTRPRGTFHLEAFAQARGMRERADVLRRSLLPRPQWIAWQYGAGGSRLKLLTGYAKHLARSPIWALRAWRFWRRSRRATPD